MRIDPAVRIVEPHRWNRLRIYKFSDGSRLRTSGQGNTFRMLMSGG
jgi:hypothetical protein